MRSWSVSSVRQFLSCSLAWYFRRTGVPAETRPLALVEGSVLHEVLAEDLRHRMAGVSFEEDEALALLEANYFMEDASGEITYGKHDRESVMDRMQRLYLHWRAEYVPRGEIVAVEEELRVELPGIDLPMLGYVDVVMETDEGDIVQDWKVTASKPNRDHLLDPLDIQKIAMVRGWEASRSRPVCGWTWSHLVKTKAPQLVDYELPVSGCDRVPELERLASVVNPTIDVMRDVLAGRRRPVPQAGFLCSGCSFRAACAAWCG